MRARATVLAAALLALVAAAVPARAQVYRFKTYNSNTGLPSNATYGVYQDRSGYIWFATDGGACRYDGVAYVTYSVAEGLPDASVRGFVEDDRGGLWILTKAGLARWDGTRFQVFTSKDGLPSDEVRAGLHAKDGTLWFGTNTGVARWDGQRFTAYGAAEGLPPGPVWSMLEDRKGTLWVGVRGGGLARLENGRFQVLGTKDGLPSPNVFQVAEDPAGGLWLAVEGGLVSYVEGRLRVYGTKDGLPSEHISSVLVDKHGRVWCGTFGGGVARLEDGHFKVFDRRNGLPDTYITALFADEEQNIWFCTMWTGVFRFVSERFATYTSSAGLGAGLISSIDEAPDGSMWFSSVNEGLARLDRAGTVQRFGKAEGMPDPGVWAMLVDHEGRVWSGGLAGISMLDHGRFRSWTTREIGGDDRINAMAEDPRGHIWMASGAARSTGVIEYDGQRFRTYGLAEGLPHLQVNSLTVDHEGHLWASTESGLARFDGERFRAWGRAEGLPGKRVMVAYEDERGRMWVGTNAGLARLEGDRFKVWRAANGLVNDFVSALVESDGQLWIGTARGISAFDGTTFRNYTVKQGLISQEITTNSALRQHDGSIWFGTKEGAVRYQAVKETMVDLPPHVHLRAIRVRDRELSAEPQVRLSWDQNSVTFDFLGLSFADEEAIRYSYRMTGLDGDWSGPDEARSVRYMNMAPGQYRFDVKARSATGLWSQPVSVSLEIAPALWQRPWFRALALLGLGGLAYAGYRWRLQKVSARQRERIDELRLLLDSIRVINSRLDLNQVLQSIAEEAARLVRGEPGGIGLVRGEAIVFTRLWSGSEWDALHHELPLGMGVPGRVARAGQAEIVSDPVVDAGLGYPAVLLPRYAGGLMDVPILARDGRVVGVLDVRRPAGREPFAEDDVRVMEALAHQAAMAIENANLYGALEEKKVELAESLWAVEELYRNEQRTTSILQELNDMKSNFIIVTSHEMRTPLTILKGHHEALLAGYLGEVSAKQAETLGICQRNVDRMITIFNEIIEMLKIDRRAPLEPCPLDLVAETEHAVSELRSFADRRRQGILVEAEGDLPVVVADAEKLKLVLENLLQNAVKFTPDEGHIRVRIFQPGPDAVQVTVEDDGVGIAAEDLDRVFDRFFTGRDSLRHGSGTFQFMAKGAGLGLAIAKGYVEAHGGRIWAESEGPDRGSAFHFVLPAGTLQSSVGPRAQAGTAVH